ncbi:MAG: hypothetical protein MJ059_01310 [Lachnospiraceae bacterium]|nr:hypothetical protein [Lachnospiraceae bacterium]
MEAGGYGDKIRAYYLNITNPASEGMGYKALKKLEGQNNAGIKAWEYYKFFFKMAVFLRLNCNNCPD